MNDQAPAPGAQEQDLIRIIESKRDQSCEAIRKEAEDQAAELFRQAYRDARSRLHQAIREERARASRRIEGAQAQARAHQRQRELQRSRLRLNRAWDLLPDALQRRWRDATSRQVWSAAVLHEALALLPPGAWVIRHAPAWPDQEISAVEEAVAQRTGKAPLFQADENIGAGICICLDGACVDGTIQGILANRAWVEARLLWEIDRSMKGNLDT
ncbi:MAG: hypothetical protein ACOY4L_06925 [Pseudomonadota bacterium]